MVAMNDPPHPDLASLTEKEKQTLRLIVRGYDAKSAARSLDLSVHTINGRLRDVRRKLAVPSSREAARLLLEAEGDDMASAPPYSLAGKEIGDEPGEEPRDQDSAPTGGAAGRTRGTAILIGAIAMSLTLALLALATLPQSDTAPSPVTAIQSADSEAVQTARDFLQLLDQGDWSRSYAATGAAFHRQNSLKAWTAASQKVRAPLGAATSRELVSAEDVPAPPNGYQLVKFRATFPDRAKAMIETVTLAREGGSWRITGVTID